MLYIGYFQVLADGTFNEITIPAGITRTNRGLGNTSSYNVTYSATDSTLTFSVSSNYEDYVNVDIYAFRKKD